MPIKSGLTGAAIAVAFFVGVWLYGQAQYRQGVGDTTADAVLAQISIEQGMQYERDRADAEYRGLVRAMETTLFDLNAARVELDRLRRSATGGSQVAGGGSGLDGTSTDWIGGFAACYAEYAELATDAAKWADMVNGLQGYIKAIRGYMGKI
ncbi:hypothetical protein ACLO87_09310 [Paenalcaligenes sp. Me52]|uniref:hypothetical protein n=1 Tax=Paenalcaligenes sp. Me52 TaxID=3392038 RepID=UPI003D277336